MRTRLVDTSHDEEIEWPTVTIVFVVYNRREELRISLRKMLSESDYTSDRVDVIVIDNASTDGSAAMVRSEFPEVELIARDTNIGAPAWNEGYAAARGDYVLTLDDDCYLPPDGLRRAVGAAAVHGADLVSFKVVSTQDPKYAFTEEEYRTGLLSFWGCAWLVRRSVLDQLGGYDPELFVWANELEFMLRFFDRGFRHLHHPEIVAQHMKPVPEPGGPIEERGYRTNARHFAYVAGKLLRRREAAEALVALLVRVLTSAVLRLDRVSLKALADTVGGFAQGLRHRDPVRNPELSRFYRRNFHSFASPLRLLPSPREALGVLTRDAALAPRRERYFERRARFYPQHSAVLHF